MNNDILIIMAKVIAIIILTPIAGGLLAGIDRRITAKMQGRMGPPLLQPFYDVFKLLQKDPMSVSPITRYYVTFALVFTIFTVVLFFMGGNFLLCVFAFTIACVFFVLAGYSSFSPYSVIGSERELLQIVCYEPMILLVAFGYYKATGTFQISEAFNLATPIITKLPLIFLGLVYVLTIKLRKSPFDLSMSHHGHQEIVKGITTEFTAHCMAMVEIMHWYETMFALGMVFIFFVTSATSSIFVALGVTLFLYFVEIAVDNMTSRIRWQLALKLSWIVTLVLGGINLYLLNIL